MFKILVLVALFPFALLAQGEGAGPCKADAEKLCKDVKPGQGRIMKCLKEHENELSAECKAKHAANKEMRKEKRKAMHEACSEDKNKFCKDVKPGEGRVRDCMKSNINQLSAPCKAEMEKMIK